MRLLIERVKSASCLCDNRITGKIEVGLLVYVCFEEGDNEKIFEKAINKIIKLRIFPDEMDKMNLSILDFKGKILLISSFSLLSDALHGNRPSFTNSLSYSLSKPLYDTFKEKLSKEISIESGVFGGDMSIDLNAWGPVSIILDINEK